MVLTKIFITGATGFIGGSVLSRLLEHPEVKSFEIVALVRSKDKAEKLNTLGVKTVLGDYTSYDLLTKSASEADIVIALANSDDLPAANAILAGLKQRFDTTGKAPILIHTSGTAIIMDNALGLHGDHTIYSDLQSDELQALPETALHRNVDIPLVNADKEGYVKAYLVTPGTVFGTATGPLVDLGIQNKFSMQVPFFVKAALARKRGGYIGAGKNVWSAASLSDTANLFTVLFDAIRKDPDSIGHGKDGYYFVENLEYSAYEIAEAIGQALVELGVADTAEPNAFSEEELTQIFGNLWPLLATNSRARGDRSRGLGWKPVDGKEALIQNVKDNVFELSKAV
ncbi:hypothetical protein H1R20_g3697, partial [Candolleomyces eurysporus]